MSDTAAVRDLIFRMADDDLIIAHRNSEWTGLGPILEEDIAFSSIAQDKLGHAQALYEILGSLGEADADTLAFTRGEADFRCCHLVEYPIGGYDFSLMRHFTFDTADMLRWEMLEGSSFEPLAKLARKIKGEIKYHLFHANTWIVQLGAKGNDESHARMQAALNEVFPLALGIFEPGDYEQALAADGVFAGEAALQERWLKSITETLQKANLVLPSVSDMAPAYGGRRGYHTEYLQPLLSEMTEVFGIDPGAEW
jgi:ring-1,2-phenylacetyl-CoA epoxidase subunit PaaC